MSALSYRVILEPDADDGGFNVVIPAFPTAHTQGDDAEDALRNAREIIELELGYLAERGLPIPPSDAEDFSGTAVVRALERAGWMKHSQVGSHVLHDPVKRGTLASILRTVEMTADELRRFL
ncbi:MAG: type II toxin-antitoxin system HicB family antitoxin [Vulcanimicrobiaceae bacterium]